MTEEQQKRLRKAILRLKQPCPKCSKWMIEARFHGKIQFRNPPMLLLVLKCDACKVVQHANCRFLDQDILNLGEPCESFGYDLTDCICSTHHDYDRLMIEEEEIRIWANVKPE